VSKPFWSREGANVVMRTREGLIETDGPITINHWCIRNTTGCRTSKAIHPLIGSWIIGEEAAGIGIREDRSRITGNLSRFVPHYLVKG